MRKKEKNKMREIERKNINLSLNQIGGGLSESNNVRKTLGKNAMLFPMSTTRCFLISIVFLSEAEA